MTQAINGSSVAARKLHPSLSTNVMTLGSVWFMFGIYLVTKWHFLIILFFKKETLERKRVMTLQVCRTKLFRVGELEL